MGSPTRHGRGPFLAVLAAACGSLAILAGPAAAVDTVYWADQTGNAIMYAPADGSAAPATLYDTQQAPEGIALDPAAGRIYWANAGTDEVRGAPLSGAGPVAALYTAQNDLEGLSVDPAGARIYWAIEDIVRGAPLNGGAGGGTIDDVFASEFTLGWVAADGPGGFLYWTRIGFEADGPVRRGPLGGGVAATLYDFQRGAQGIAVDSAAGKLWFTTFSAQQVRTGVPDGSVASSTVYSSQVNPSGIAADTAAGRLYWGVGNSVVAAPIAGGGTVDTVGTGGAQSVVRGVAVLRKPLGTGAPLVSPTSGPSGTLLTCSPASWSPGVPGAFLYRAPTTLSNQWQRNGTDIAGATATTYTAPQPGTYTCRETGANQAGSTDQPSSNEAIIADPVVPPPAAPVVTLSPDSHDFGSLDVDTGGSARQTFTVANTGGSTATIASLGLTGPDGTSFALLSNGCASTLAAGSTCEARVAFDPESPGAKSSTLELKSDGGDDSSALTGTGTQAGPGPAPEPIPAALGVTSPRPWVLHRPVLPVRCRTSRRTTLRRCRVEVLTLSGRRIGTGVATSASGATAGAGRALAVAAAAGRDLHVSVKIGRRGQALVAPALGGVPVRVRGVGRLTDGRVRRDGTRTRLFAERHHLLPPRSGIFQPDLPILLPSGRRFLSYIARHARRVDVIRCDGHAAELPLPDPIFATALASARARVACRVLRRLGMNGQFVEVGHSNTVSRNPGLDRRNPSSWPPDRRSGITLIRH